MVHRITPDDRPFDYATSYWNVVSSSAKGYNTDFAATVVSFSTDPFSLFNYESPRVQIDVEG